MRHGGRSRWIRRNDPCGPAAGRAILHRVVVRAGKLVRATLRELRVEGVDISRYELEFAADYYGVRIPRPYSLERFAGSVERVPQASRRRAASAYVADHRDAARPRDFANLLSRLVRGELLNHEN